MELFLHSPTLRHEVVPGHKDKLLKIMQNKVVVANFKVGLLSYFVPAVISA
jgi:hypothetical protein